MVSGTTLSRQPENIRGVGVARVGCGSTCEDLLRRRVLKGRAAGESGFQIVPPFELVPFA